MDTPLVDHKRHYKANIVWTVAAIALGTCSYSYNGAIIGSTLGQPSFYVYMGLDEANTDLNAVIGTITGLFYAGGFVGVILNSYLADKIGRKMTALTAGVILIVSAACLAGSVNVAMFEAFRFFAGLGSHMFYLSIPLWVTELVPPKDRGVLVGIVGLNGAVGYLISAWISVAFYHYKGTPQAQWRAPLALGCAFPLILLALMPWLPESPRWLLTRGRNQQAMDILRRLHTSDADPDHLYAAAEFAQMEQQYELERHLGSSWLDMVRRPSNRKRAVIAFLLPIILYSTGNLVITTYAATIFGEIGYSAGQSLILLAGLYTTATAANVCSLLWVDRIPRNVIFTVGVLCAAVILSIHTALVARFLGTDNKTGLSAAAAFLFLFLAFFNFFLEGPSQYYTSEIFPTHLRSKGMTISVAGFCLVDILWLELAPTAQAAIGWRYYLVFICLSVFGAAYMYTTFPNTLGLPLEEVAKLFGEEDMVAVYQEDIQLDHNTHEVVNLAGHGHQKIAVEKREGDGIAK